MSFTISLILGIVLLLGLIALFLFYKCYLLKSRLHQIEGELLSNAERFELLIKNTPAAVAMFDNKMCYISASSRWISDYNLNGIEIIGKSHYEIFPEILHMPKWLDIHKRTLAGEVFENVEDSWIREDGRKEWVHYALHPWLISNNKIGGLIMFTEVITKRKETEASSLASEETFRLAMENAVIGQALLAPDGRWMKVNNALCDLLGYTEEELLKVKLFNITHPDDLEISLNILNQLLSGELKSKQVEKRYIHKNGNTIWARVEGAIVHNEDGTPKYIISQIMDITRLKEADRVRDEFISIVSHELRTPVTSINLSLSLLRQETSHLLDESVIHLIDTANRNSSRLMFMVNDIIDIQKITLGELKYQIDTHNLLDMIKRAVEENAIYAQKYGVTFSLTLNPEDVFICVDESRMMQILGNLLSNAAKFSHNGGIVRIDSTITGQAIRLSIKDEGIGIPKQFHAQIFQKFSQVGLSASKKNQGTGLGLYISKEMVEKMGGKIGFSSVENLETEFWIEFPITSPTIL